MKILYLISIILVFFLNSCSSVRQSAGVTRKSIDEFAVLENPPLVIPPNYNLLPPEQLEEKNIQDFEQELAKEILFGLDNDNIESKKQLSTMDLILSKSEALNVNSSIREEINKDFAKEIEAKNIFEFNFKDDVEILDAINESERLRNKNFEDEINDDAETLIETESKNIKKKKRFIFF